MTSQPVPIPPAPELISPVGGTTLPQGDTTLEWKPVRGAVFYVFDLQREVVSNSSYDVVAGWRVSDTKAVISGEQLIAGNYRWDIRAYDGYAWSETISGKFAVA